MTGCSTSGDEASPTNGSGEKLDVVVAFYPFECVTERVAGDHATITSLTEKAVERQLEKARGKLREWILAELRETVAAEDEVQAELALLQRFAGEALAGLT